MRPVAAVALGATLILAFQPHDLWFVAIAVAGAFALLVRDQPVRRAALLGFLVGAGFFVPFLPWIGAEVGPIPWLLLAVVEAAFFAPLGVGVMLVQRLRAWPIWAAAVWVAVEALRGRVPYGGFTWGKLAFSQVEGPVLGIAALGGSVLMSFAVALAGGLLASALLARPVWHRVAALAGALAIVVAGTFVPSAQASNPSITVAVVQGNVPRPGLDFNAEKRVILDNHVEATHQLAADIAAGTSAQPDIVVWPENSSDINPFADSAAHAAIGSAVRAVGVPTLVGTLVPTDDQRNVENTSVVWDPVTGPGQTYVKRHPMPFGEYIPMRDIARIITDAVDRQPRDFVAGQEVGVLDMGVAQVGGVICFEVAFDNLVRDVVREGAQILAVQTNNATFGFAPMTEQQLAMSRIRAIEHDRTVLVAALAGVSAVIDRDGAVRERRELFTRGVMVADVELSEATTPATTVGEWPEWVLCGLALGAAGLAWRSRRGDVGGTSRDTGSGSPAETTVSVEAR